MTDVITNEMLDAKVRGKVRINLHVYVTHEGATAYHTLHLGFFPKGAFRHIAEGLDARGIAFNSNVKRQIGHVKVVVCLMKDGEAEISWKSYDYESPRLFEEAL